MDTLSRFGLVELLKQYVTMCRHRVRERFEFSTVHLSEDGTLTAEGTKRSFSFKVSIRFSGANNLQADCSQCSQSYLCSHTSAFVLYLQDSGIAEQIENNDHEPGDYAPADSAKNGVDHAAWRAQFRQLARELNLRPDDETVTPRFPVGREVVYVIQPNNEYGAEADDMVIRVATRPADSKSFRNGSFASSKRKKLEVRRFKDGVFALANSPDPMDREIAEKVALQGDGWDPFNSTDEITFTITHELSVDLLARLAKSGRLFDMRIDDKGELYEELIWLSDDRFEPKFEISPGTDDQFRLGLCAVSPQLTVPLNNVQSATSWYFIDKENRLGVFRQRVNIGLFDAIEAADEMRIPRADMPELIKRLTAQTTGLGLEFSNCDDIRPPSIECAPKPRIHIRAQRPEDEKLDAYVQVDYDGIAVPVTHRGGEIYDKNRSALLRIDGAAHEGYLSLLDSLGLKVSKTNKGDVASLTKKKLPTVVRDLIQQGWHVEADGKIYRSGHKFDFAIVSGIDWFELHGKAHFDEVTIDLPRLLRSLREGESTVVLDDGTIGMIPEEWVRKFASLTTLGKEEDGTITFGKAQVGLLDALIAELPDINIDEQFFAAREALRNFDRIETREAPAGFVGSLRPYQKLALGWFEFLRNLGFGGCLADDMGLGKTIQVLALLEQRRESKSGPSLIVVPRSLVFNWMAEATKFSPALRVLDQSHSQRTRGTEHLNDFDIVITTYGTLRRDAAFLKDFAFDYVILDEAQAIKNANTEASKAVRVLNGRHKLALSGTPIENHLGELWSLFDFLNPGMLGRAGRFADLAGEVEADQRQLLAAVVRPFILRRTKKQVAPELPDRVEQTVMVELDTDQRRGYNELRDYYRAALTKKIETEGIGKSQIVILEALLRLRQAACHPGLIDPARKADPSAKLDELMSRLSSAVESGERILVFSQFTSFLAIVKDRLNKEKVEFLYLDGKTRNRQQLVEQFQSGTGPAVFLISLKAGGVGLNLTAARSVYLLDPWWNPAVEAQAIDRSHRIGQQQTVFATRLIAADTVEQKVLELQSKKKGLADAIVNADNSSITSLTKEDLEMLLA